MKLAVFVVANENCLSRELCIVYGGADVLSDGKTFIKNREWETDVQRAINRILCNSKQSLTHVVRIIKNYFSSQQSCFHCFFLMGFFSIF